MQQPSSPFEQAHAFLPKVDRLFRCQIPQAVIHVMEEMDPSGESHEESNTSQGAEAKGRARDREGDEEPARDEKQDAPARRGPDGARIENLQRAEAGEPKAKRDARATRRSPPSQIWT